MANTRGSSPQTTFSGTNFLIPKCFLPSFFADQLSLSLVCSAVSDYTSCFLPSVVRRLLLISFPSFVSPFPSLSVWFFLAAPFSLPLCLAFPHSIIILSLAPSVESLERPPLRSTVRSMESEMLRVFFPLRTVEQKEVHPSLWPSLSPGPLSLSPAPVRLRTARK